MTAASPKSAAATGWPAAFGLATLALETWLSKDWRYDLVCLVAGPIAVAWYESHRGRTV